MPKPIQPLEDRFWSKVNKQGPVHSVLGTPCWEWMGARAKKTSSKLDYGLFRHIDKMRSAHRVAWELTHGPIPGGTCVLHRCDNPPCVNPDHLFLGTQVENLRDMVSKGRAVYFSDKGKGVPKGTRIGSKNPNSLLTEELVFELRHVHASGMTFSEMSEKFKISKTTLRNAVLGRTWSRLPLKDVTNAR